MVTNPRLLPFPLASTTGELADDNQIVIDSSDLDNALAGFEGTNLRELNEYLDDNLFTRGTMGSTSPFFFFERLTQASGGGIVDNDTININRDDDVATSVDISATGDGHSLVLVPERTASGGLLAGSPFEALHFGEIVVKTSTAVILVCSLRFYHFSNQPNEFISSREVEIRAASVRRQAEGIGTWNSTFPITLGAALPSPPGGVITQEMLDTPIQYRVELNIKAFDNSDGETRVAARLDLLQFTNFSIDYRQHNLILGEQGPAGGTLPLPIRIFSDSSSTIDASNLRAWQNSNNVLSTLSPATRDITLPSSSLSQFSDGTDIEYPYVIRITHLGGVIRGTNGVNRLNVGEAVGSPFLLYGGNEVRSINLDRGDVLDVLYIDQNINPLALPVGSLAVPEDALPGTLILRPTVVDATDETTFVNSLRGEVPQQGYGYVVGTSGNVFSVGFVNVGDVVVALVNNPSTSSSSPDWNVLRGFNDHPIDLAELHFLQQITEVDNKVVDGIIDNNQADIRFYLVDPSTFTNVSQLTDANGALPDNANAFQQQADSFTDTLIVTVPQIYITSQTAEDINILQQNFDLSDVVQTLNLADDFTDITGTIGGAVAGTRYYQLSGGAHGGVLYYRGNSVSSALGQLITAQALRTERHFSVNGDTVDLTQNVRDLPETSLSPLVQDKLNRTYGLAFLNRAKLALMSATVTQTDLAPYTGFGSVKQGRASGDPDHYHESNPLQLPPSPDASVVWTVYVPDFINLASVAGSVSGTPGTVSQIVPSLIVDQNMYTVTVPMTALDPDDVDFFTFEFTQSELTEIDLNCVIKVSLCNLDQDVIDHFTPPDNPVTPPTSLPQNLQTFSHDLTVDTVGNADQWQDLEPLPGTVFTPLVAAFWTEDRRQFTGNFFDDITPGVTIDGFDSANIRYYADPDDPRNTGYPGASSYIDGAQVNIANLSGATPITSGFQKLLLLEWSLDESVGAGLRHNVVSFGAGSEPLIEYDGAGEQLVARIGRGDGGQRSRTIVEGVSGINTQLGTQVNDSETGVARFPVPGVGGLAVYPEEFTISIRLWVDGINSGDQSVPYTVTNIAVSQAQTTQEFSYTVPVIGAVSHTFGLSYDASLQEIRVSTVTPLTNAALVFEVSASFERTETWNVPATYADFDINAGDGHDANGIFDPSNYEDAQVGFRNAMLVLVQKLHASDEDLDPELSIKVIVDGQFERGNQPDGSIRLHRQAADFTFNDIRLNNSISVLTRVMCVDWTGQVPTEQQLQNLYRNRNAFLGIRRLRSLASDTLFAVNGVMEAEYFRPTDGTLEHRSFGSVVGSTTLPSNYQDYRFIEINLNDFEDPELLYPIFMSIGDLDGLVGPPAQNLYTPFPNDVRLQFNSTTRVLSTSPTTSLIGRVLLHR